LGSENSPSTNGGAILDPTNPGPPPVNLPPIPGLFAVTATITVVPEPSSMILGGLAVAGFAAIRRRRKAKATEVAA
jgi:hypothetical protein